MAASLSSRGLLSFRCKPRCLSSLFVITIFPLIFLSMVPQNSDGQLEEWCIADEQFTDEELQQAMNWACGNGADCSKIQPNQACFLHNALKDHASYAFNSYYQNMKHRGGTCYFNAAAIITGLDPSDGACKFEFLP